MAEKGFNTPTDIQSLTLSAAILGRKDILGAAETGSGKTLAFGIPILNGILQLKDGSSTLLQYRKSQALAEKTLEPSADPVAKSKKRQTRDNCTPPPEECNNFPVLANTKDDQTAQIDATDSKPLYALILTPTRELAVQVKDHLKAAAKYTGIQVAAIFGGLAHVKQERVLRKCPEIVVATPGRLWELISEGNPHLNKLENLNFLVIDETDRMVEKGHFDELKLLLGRLNADPVKKSQRQNFVFSATLSMVHDLPGHLQTKKNGRKKVVGKQTSAQKLQHLIDMIGMAQPKIVDITQKMGTATLLTECRITCQLNEKDLYLYYFLQRHPGRTIVFCNSVDCVRRLAQLFAFLDCQPRPLHAHMNQRQRLKNLERFTASDTALLVATDVAARGLDIPNVQHVIHYQVPRTSENYVHRSGRTARAKTEGLTLLLMEPSEIKDYVRLCRTLGRSRLGELRAQHVVSRIPNISIQYQMRLLISANDLPLFPVSERHLKAVRARVDLARQVDVLELKVRRKQCDIGWLKKSANEMDIIVDDMSDFSETELYDSDDGGDRHKIKRQLKQKRDALTALLSKSLFPKGFSYKYPTSTGQLDVPSMMDKDNAVDLMKTTIESNRTAKNK